MIDLEWCLEHDRYIANCCEGDAPPSRDDLPDPWPPAVD